MEKLRTSRPAVLLAAPHPLASTLEGELTAVGCRVTVATRCSEGRVGLRGGRPDVLVVAPELADGDALALLELLPTLVKRPQVAVVPAEGDVAEVVRASRWGARALLMPFMQREHLAALVAGLGAAAEPGPVKWRDVAPLFTGRSAAAREVAGSILGAAADTGGLLVTGEDGTGRHRVARAVHLLSERRGGPFVTVRVSAFSARLLEVDLLGGSPDSASALERARGGTLYLDGVDLLEPEVQVRLATALRERADELRAIVATAAGPRAVGPAGRLRPELLQQVTAQVIALSPLRTRSEDLPQLALLLLRQLAAERGPCPTAVAPDALDGLAEGPWLGNERELEMVLAHALLRCRGGVFEARHLPAATEADAAATLPLPDLKLESAERALIERALEAAGGRKTRAAELLGINRATLYNKLRAYGLEDRIRPRRKAAAIRG